MTTDNKKITHDESEDKKIKKTMDYSIKQGVGYAISIGSGNNFFTPYALALKASNIEVSLLSSIPNLFMSILQMFTPKLMEKHDRKKMVLSAIFIQALIFTLIILLFLIRRYAIIIFIILVTLYTSMSAIKNPAWRSWISDIVPENMRGKFFGKRQKIIIIVQILTMLLAGFILDKFRKINVFYGFVIIFSIAFVGLIISLIFMSKHYEPKLKIDRSSHFTFIQFIKKAPKNNFGRFALFIGLMAMSVYIAAPFFSVYMLRNLNFSYVIYTIVNVASFIGLALGMAFWGKLSDEIGNKKVLEISSYFISIYPFFWFLSTSPIFLSVINVLSGFFWAGFNLSSFNFVFDAVTRERRGLCSAYTNSLTGLGIFVGSLLGGLISKYAHVWFGVIPLLFIISGALRILMSTSFMKKIREVRTNVRPFTLQYFVRRNP